MPRVREVFEASTDFTVGIEEEFAILDPASRSLTQRFDELRDAAQDDSGPRGGRGGRADPLRDRDPLGSRRELRRRRREAARGAQPPVRARRGARPAARRDRHAPVEPLAGPADHRHRALPPRRELAPVRRLAQQHLQRPRARGRERPGAGGPRLRPAARRDAGAACDLGQLAVPRRAPLRPPLRALADLHEELSRAAGSRKRSAAGASTPTTSTSSVRTNSIVEFTQVWWSVRPHHSYGTVEMRICDAQTSGDDSTALAGLITACVAQAALRLRRGRPLRRSARARARGELLARDPLRARRQADRHRAPRGVPGRRRARAAARLDGAGASRARLEPRLPDANGAQRQKRALAQGASMEEVYAAEVALTQRTYAAEEVTT